MVTVMHKSCLISVSTSAAGYTQVCIADPESLSKDPNPMISSGQAIIDPPAKRHFKGILLVD